jgi:hypothetical protein
MIKGMDIMASESAKFAFERDKHKYSSSEHLEHSDKFKFHVEWILRMQYR